MNSAQKSHFLKNAKSLLKDRKTLPLLPQSAQKIISSVSDEFIGMKDLARCIEEDPVISARIVGLANSPFYGLSDEIASVEEAIIRVLGLDLTRGVAIGMACSAVLDSSQVSGFDQKRFWQSALTRSALSSSIASHSSVLSDELPRCSLIGLLANIGLFAAVAVVPEQTEAVFEPGVDSIQAKMIADIGCDSRHITAALMELWMLPSNMQTVFQAQCNDDWQDGGFTPSQACLFLANAFCRYDIEEIQKHELTPILIEKLGLVTELETIDLTRKKIHTDD